MRRLSLSSERRLGDGASGCAEVAAQLDMVCLSIFVITYLVINLGIFGPLLWQFRRKKKQQMAHRTAQRIRRRSVSNSAPWSLMPNPEDLRISGSWDYDEPEPPPDKAKAPAPASATAPAPATAPATAPAAAPATKAGYTQLKDSPAVGGGEESLAA